jgi:hypothetical protein
MVKYKPSEFEIEKEWNTATPSENKGLLEEMGMPTIYCTHTWKNLPETTRKKIGKYIEEEEFIMPPKAGMTQEILEPQWMQIDCENNGGTWVKGFHRDGTWVEGYCRKSHNNY